MAYFILFFRNRTLEAWGSIPHTSTGSMKGSAQLRGPLCFRSW